MITDADRERVREILAKVRANGCTTVRAPGNERCDLPYDHRQRCHFPSEDTP